MRALVVEELAPEYAGCVLKQIPTPDPGPGEVLVEVRAAAVKDGGEVVKVLKEFAGFIPGDAAGVTFDADKVGKFALHKAELKFLDENFEKVFGTKTVWLATRRRPSSKARPSVLMRCRIISKTANALCPSLRCSTPG